MKKEKIISSIQTIHLDIQVIEFLEKNYVLVKTKFGVCKVQKGNLLSGSKPTISTAIDKTDYFINKLFEVNSSLKVVSEYKGSLEYINVQNKYGVCRCIANNLLSNQTPCIESSINKTEYFINQSKEIHLNKYDYSNTVYINSNVKVKINCKEHGEFEQLPGHHLVTQGCLKCGHKNKKGGNYYKNTKNFNKTGNMYILKFSSQNEVFFKFGVSVNFEKRINTLKNDCKNTYSIEIIKRVTNTVKYCFELEQRFKLKIWKKRRTYIPKIKFGGMYECFK